MRKKVTKYDRLAREMNLTLLILRQEIIGYLQVNINQEMNSHFGSDLVL